MRRRSRFLTALALVAALLFAPLAIAGHGCPYGGNGDAMQDSGAMPCHKAPPAKPALCDQHCSTSGAVSFEGAKVPAPAPVAIVSALRVPSLDGALVERRPPGRIDAGPAPPPVRTTVLRI